MKPSARELRDQRHIWAADPMVQGSARWADAQHLAARGYGPGGSHTLGYLPALDRKAGALPVTYSGDRHQMIVAPTRSGKGVSGAIMRLLEHTGSAVVVDPKNGELALRTAIYRRDILKQNVVLIDPFDVVASRLGFKALGYNPIERLEPFGDDAFDDAMLAAESCVIPDGGMESHWSGEAAALIAGLCLWSAEQGRPSFGHVRALLNASGTAFQEMVAAMLASPFELVRAAGGRLDNKEERELSGVLSTAHRNTHFLESPRLAKSLERTGFDLKAIGKDTTIYIVLPGHRIRTAARWLRIVVGGLIAAVTTLPAKPAKPLLFIIEEMASLQRMPILEQAVGLMAGYGLQLLMIVQDFTQLRDLYRDRWESFPANSGTIQCFGTNDRFTAEYLSAVFGQTSVEQLSLESARERGNLFGDPEYRSAADSVIGRRLISPDELMALHPAVQVMKLAASRPFIGYRPAYFLDHRFRSRDGRPLWWADPAEPHYPLAPPLRFTKPGIDLGAVLAQHLKVG